MFRQRNPLLLLLTALAVFATACSGSQEPVETEDASEAEPDDGGDASEETAADDGEPNTVVMAVNSIAEHLTTSPWGGPASHVLFTGLGPTLVGYDGSGLPGNGCEQMATGENMTNRLAESIEIAEDGTRVTVVLKEVVSPYGNTLTAEDVKWSFETIMEHQPVARHSISRGGYDSEAEDFVTVIDERTVELKLTEANALTVEILANNLNMVIDSTEVRKHVTDEDPLGREWMNNNSAHFSGWDLESFAPGSSVTFTADPDWPIERGNVDRLRIQAVPETSTRLQLMTTGEVDLANGFEYDEWRTLADTDGVTVLQCQSVNRDSLMLNTNTGPLSDPLVRDAISLAIDREAIVTGAYNGFGTPSRSTFPSAYGLPETDTWYEFDPDQARELLAEAGYPDGFDLELTYSPSRPGPVASRSSVLIQTMLSDIGINVDLREIINPSEAQAEIQQKGNYEALLWAEPAPLTAPDFVGAAFLVSDAPSNTTGWGSEEYDDLIGELRATPLEESDARREILSRLDDIANEGKGILYLVEVPNMYAISDRIEPFAPEPNGQVYYNNISTK